MSGGGEQSANRLGAVQVYMYLVDDGERVHDGVRLGDGVSDGIRFCTEDCRLGAKTYLDREDGFGAVVDRDCVSCSYAPPTSSAFGSVAIYV